MTAATYYRLALATTLATVLLLVFGIGALGIIGEGGRPDRVYLGVFVVLVVGTVIARLRAHGMALALLATALAQMLTTGSALVAGLHRPGGASVADILAISAMYASLFVVAAWLFRRAAEQHSEVAASRGT